MLSLAQDGCHLCTRAISYLVVSAWIRQQPRDDFQVGTRCHGRIYKFLTTLESAVSAMVSISMGLKQHESMTNISSQQI